MPQLTVPPSTVAPPTATSRTARTARHARHIRALRQRGELLAAALRPPGKPVSPTLVTPPPDVLMRSPRLVPEPVFILSPIRAGSTLLRVLLNSHSRIRAPHEMHLRTLHVTLAREFSGDVMADLGLDKDELEHLLWDRVLHLQLQRSGKSVIVDKTPANVLMWKRLRRAWPKARYVFLLRDPVSIVESVVSRRADGDHSAATLEVLDYAHHLDAARAALRGVSIRYEDLTSDPARTMRTVCSHLGVPWEPGMLDYGRFDHGAFRPFAGDWSENIRSGVIQPARVSAPSTDTDPAILAIAQHWGYGRG